MDRNLPRLIITVGPPGPVTMDVSERVFQEYPEGNLIVVTPVTAVTGKYSLLYYDIDWNAVNRLFTKEAP